MTDLPKGSWHHSAKDAKYEEPTLTAQLQQSDGCWVLASINCRTTDFLENINGQFKIDKKLKVSTYYRPEDLQHLKEV